MGRNWKGFCVALILVLLTVAGCARTPVLPAETPTPTGLSFPTGTLTNGDSSVEFKPDGTFLTTGSLGSDTGTYSFNGGQLVVTSQSCGNVKGTYGWVFDGGTLTLHAIDDPCFNRLNLLSSGVWSLNP